MAFIELGKCRGQQVERVAEDYCVIGAAQIERQGGLWRQVLEILSEHLASTAAALGVLDAVEEGLEQDVQALGDGNGLPGFVWREFERFLDCGVIRNCSLASPARAAGCVLAAARAGCMTPPFL